MKKYFFFFILTFVLPLLSTEIKEEHLTVTSSIEKYAKNIGLVYKELRFLKSQNNFGLPWEERA